MYMTHLNLKAFFCVCDFFDNYRVDPDFREFLELETGKTAKQYLNENLIS